jgi:RNA polymerase sigma factor (sigma-70 family)
MASGTQDQGTKVSQPWSAGSEAPADRELLRRFSEGHDEAAFALLVARHGPMVLGVCRRILVRYQDAEDAFQATFLVLARKAGSIARPELLANWLHGVAARTARKARVMAARRAHHERQIIPVAPLDSLPEADWRDLWPHIDEELQRLPDKYRVPLVLCYLNGLTNKEAADRLGWPAGSISYRLARGRELLRQRLGHRVCSPALFALLLHDKLMSPSLSPELLRQTVQSAVALVRDGALMTAASPFVRELVESALPALTGRKVALVLAILLGLAAAGTVGAAAAGYTPWSGESSNSSNSGAGGCH